jgi:hypothetical protein
MTCDICDNEITMMCNNCNYGCCEECILRWKNQLDQKWKNNCPNCRKQNSFKSKQIYIEDNTRNLHLFFNIEFDEDENENENKNLIPLYIIIKLQTNFLKNKCDGMFS